MQISGSSAIVTGAASGLGAATAAALAAAGAHVVGFDLASGWERAGAPAPGITSASGDVTNADDVAAAVAFLCSERASFINGAGIRVDSGSVSTIAG